MEVSMNKVAIVTDSTATIPADNLKSLPISVIPLQVIWGEESYRDGIDINPGDFYKRLGTEKTIPSTSQATPAAFREVYAKLLDEGYDILSIHISSLLSGTLDSAAQARQKFDADRIQLVDSLNAGMALGFQALSAARIAQQGASLQECKLIAEKARSQSGVFFVVKTLDFLHRGGRIGGGAAFLGTVLNLKPILGVSEGKIIAFDKVRTMNKALDQMLDLVEDKISGLSNPVRFAAHYTDSTENAEELLERARQRFSSSQVTDVFLSPVSPVLGTHIGPGALGMAYMAGM
jgi:DegV family protein with EDD domain